MLACVCSQVSMPPDTHHPIPEPLASHGAGAKEGAKMRRRSTRKGWWRWGGEAADDIRWRLLAVVNIEGGPEPPEFEVCV